MSKLLATVNARGKYNKILVITINTDYMEARDRQDVQLERMECDLELDVSQEVLKEAYYTFIRDKLAETYGPITIEKFYPSFERLRALNQKDNNGSFVSDMEKATQSTPLPEVEGFSPSVRHHIGHDLLNRQYGLNVPRMARKFHPSLVVDGQVVDKGRVEHYHELICLILETLGGEELVASAAEAGFMILVSYEGQGNIPARLTFVLFGMSLSWEIVNPATLPNAGSSVTWGKPFPTQQQQWGSINPTPQHQPQCPPLEPIHIFLVRWLEINGVTIPGRGFGSVTLEDIVAKETGEG